MLNREYEYVSAIAREGTLSGAAVQLGVSQPALTRYIQKLEKEYGMQLLERSRNSCELTEAGRLYLQEKTKIAAIEQNLRQGLKSINEKRVSVTIGTGPARGSNTLPAATKRFLKKHPNVDIKIYVTGELDLIPALAHGELDMAYGALGQIGDEMETTYVSTELMGILVPRSLGIDFVKIG